MPQDPQHPSQTPPMDPHHALHYPVAALSRALLGPPLTPGGTLHPKDPASDAARVAGPPKIEHSQPRRMAFLVGVSRLPPSLTSSLSLSHLRLEAAAQVGDGVRLVRLHVKVVEVP